MHEWQIYTFDHTGNNDRIHDVSNLTRLSSKQVITRIFLRSIAVAGTVVLLGAAMASAAPATLDGVNALPDTQQSVAGKLVATPGRNNSEALDFVLMPMGSDKPITKYETELTKQLHVIAISDDFKAFLHDHVTQAGKDGHLRLNMTFLHPGLYHVYADSTPTGLGQQVLRFDLAVGTAQASRKNPDLATTGLEGADGPYSVRLDPLDLSAGKETELMLHIQKQGRPATDLHPFLGVAAHAVLIDTDDLSYLHVHPSPGAGEAPAGTAHHMEGMQGTGHMNMPGMGGPGGMNMGQMPAMPASAKVDPDLSLHLTPPKSGTYALWIQFVGGAEVRTVPFVLSVR